MTLPAPEPAIPRGEASDADRLYLERVRLGLRLVNAGIATVFVGWIVINPGKLPLLSIIQALNFAVVGTALWLLRDPCRSRFNEVVAFVGYAVTIFATAGVGIVAGDGTTPLLILVGMSVIAAVLVPWHPVWHLAGMMLTIVAASWTVATVFSSQSLLWRNAGAIAPTFVAAVYISRLLSRQRTEAAHAAAERRSREARLEEANRRLENEIEEHRKTEDRLRFAMRELDHRVRNTLATVQSVTEQTLRSSSSMREFSDAFTGRIHALARIHGALTEHHLAGLTLTELVDLVVGPYCHHAERVHTACDGTLVPERLVRPLGMALHELATNAAKYGALSNAAGRVAISARADDARTRLHVNWTERGGPSVSVPARRGFGSRLIEEALAYESDGRASLDFPAEGVCCEIELPMPPP